MSGIYEHENQMIMRFPKEVAQKIREQMGNQEMQIRMDPFNEDDQQKFKVKIPSIGFDQVGYVVELPTITESYKSRDFINLYKSNNINQMIWVEEPSKMVGVRKIVEKDEDGSRKVKMVGDSGLSPPAYDIRKDFYRKQPQIALDEIRKVEKELDEIQKQFMSQQQGDEESVDLESRSYTDNQQKRRRKKYNKF